MDARPKTEVWAEGLYLDDGYDLFVMKQFCEKRTPAPTFGDMVDQLFRQTPALVCGHHWPGCFAAYSDMIEEYHDPPTDNWEWIKVYIFRMKCPHLPGEVTHAWFVSMSFKRGMQVWSWSVSSQEVDMCDTKKAEYKQIAESLIKKIDTSREEASSEATS
jgi:hypothetical protein